MELCGSAQEVIILFNLFFLESLAAILLQELAAEQRWTESFAKSQDALEKLAQEALAEHRAGLTKPL